MPNIILIMPIIFYQTWCVYIITEGLLSSPSTADTHAIGLWLVNKGEVIISPNQLYNVADVILYIACHN